MQNSTFLIIGGLTIGLKKNGNKTKAPSKRVVHSVGKSPKKSPLPNGELRLPLERTKVH